MALIHLHRLVNLSILTVTVSLATSVKIELYTSNPNLQDAAELPIQFMESFVMPRSRNIKPAFFTNDDLADCDPLARLLFIGLWCIADSEGRLKDKPRQIKVQILPYDDCNTDLLLINLEQSGFIQRYTVQGQPLIQVVNFTMHQNPHKNERMKGSEFGSYDDRDKKIEEKQKVKEESGKIQINLDKDGTNREDSLLLIPDSLNPLTDSLNLKDDSLMSSKLDDVEKIISYLNEKAGKKFEFVESNKKLVRARIKEGHPIEKIVSVIDYKCREWIDDPKFKKYLRPATLFNAEKFNQYVGELGVETPDEKNDREMQEWINEGLDEGITEGDLYEH